MIIGIDPKVDYAFKHLLGRESTRAILIDVIDKVLNPPPGHAIQDVLFPDVPDYHLQFYLLEAAHRLRLAEDIEFHVLELPKFTKTPEQLQNDLDVWLYFLQNAETMDLEAVPALMRQPLVVRAMEELKMLTQSEIERERYESRRKLQLDINTGMHAARTEGLKEGIKEGAAKGEQIGAIHLCQRLLNRSQTPTEELFALPLADLVALADQLQRQLPTRE